MAREFFKKSAGEFPATISVLEEYAEVLKSLYSSKTESVEVVDRVVINNGMIEVQFELSEFWKWIEHGRGPGKFPPPDVIESWITKKGIIPQAPNIPGPPKIPTIPQLTYLIGRKIANEGTEAKNYLSDSIETILPEFMQRIQEAMAEDVESIIVIELMEVADNKVIKIINK